MSNSNPKSTPITVCYKEINETYVFSTVRKAAEFFGVFHYQTIYYIKKTKSFLGVCTLLRKNTQQNN